MIRRPPRSTLFPYTTALPIACQQGQSIYALGINQSAPADRQAMRQEAVLRDGPGKSRKIGEGRVSRQSQNYQDRSNSHSVEDALADRKSTRLNSSHLG